MHEALNRNLYLVKEHVGFFKAANNFDIYDPQTGQIVLECREERLGMFTKMFRFSDYKRMTPFDIDVRTPQGAKELFTSADNYMLEISGQVPAYNPVRQLIIGAVMCIDLVLKE